jgi:4-amino-4-deoxy-L-arabinose transferase-like glycosyltransferase
MTAVSAAAGQGRAPSRLASRLAAVRGLWWAVGLAGVLSVAAVVMRPLIPIDETRYLTVAWEMRLSHDWLVPHLNGETYSHKPPMMFWLINLAWSLFGENVFVARLVPAIFLPVTVWLAGILGQRVGGRLVGDRAALIAVSFVVFAITSTLVMFDAMLTAACLAALIGLTIAADGRWARGLLLVAAMIGAGILIKGPAALIHILPAALLAPLWSNRRQNWLGWYAGVLAAVVVGTAIALSWALPAAKAGGPEFGHMILLGQTTGRMIKAFDHARPFWYFLALSPALLLPWTVSRNLWSAVFDRTPSSEPGSRIGRLPWIAAVGTFVLFSLVSGKQIHYVSPAMPSLAIGIAILLTSRPKAVTEDGFAVVAFVLGAAMVLSYPLSLLGEGGPPYALAVGGAVTMLGGVMVWHLRRMPAAAGAAATAVIFAGLHVGAVLGGLSSYDPSWVSSLLRIPAGERSVAVAGSYAGEYGYAAHLTRPVDRIDPWQGPGWLAAHPGGVLVHAYREHPASDRPPVELRPYRGGMLGVWTGGPPLVADTLDAPATR